MHAPIPQRRRSVLVIVLAMLAALAVALPGFADHSVDFELDGDVQVTNTGNADWATFFTGSGPSNNISLKSDTSGFPAGYIPGEPAADHALPDTTTFTQGSKDTLNISDWTCTRSNNVNNKVDIVNAYSAGYREPHSNDLHLYFGIEIRAPEGNSNVGIWFLKDGDVGCERLGGGSQPFSGGHEIGDVLLVAAFTNGGLTANIDAYEWVGSGGSHGSLDLVGQGVRCQGGVLSGDMCATVNDGDLQTPWNSPTRSGDSLERNQFFEGGINISQVFGTQPEDECFTRFLANTRSSQSLTATLFDYGTGELPICGGLTVEKVTDPAGVNQNFNFSISGPGANENFILNASAATTAKKEFDEVLAGTYRITEQLVGGWDLVSVNCGTATTTPVLDDGVQIGVDVVVGVGGDVTCTFTNRLRHSIMVVKTESLTNGLLGGAAFTATGPSPDTGVHTLTEGPSGVHCVDNLVPGTYGITETQTPTGYDPNTNIPDVSTTNTQTCAQRLAALAGGTAAQYVAAADRNVINDPTPVDLTVLKRKSSMTADGTPFNSNVGLAGFEFTLERDDDGTWVEVATSTTAGAQGVTNFASGILQVGETYRVCETGVPTGQTDYWTSAVCQTFTAQLGQDVTRTFHNAPKADVSITFSNVTGYTSVVIDCGDAGTLNVPHTQSSGTLNLDKLGLGDYDCEIKIRNGAATTAPSD